jgi:hypothetical protein
MDQIAGLGQHINPLAVGAIINLLVVGAIINRPEQGRHAMFIWKEVYAYH